MRIRRIAMIAGTTALVAAGAGVAVGATSSDKAERAESNILADAAKQLGTTPEKLRDALSSAEQRQLDQAVKDGDLTQEQADAIKQRLRTSGRVLGIPGGHGPGAHGPGAHGFGHRGPGGPDRGGPRGPGLFHEVAKAIGITQERLFTQLRAGKSIAEIVKASGKSLDQVKSAVKAAVKAKLDQAVKDGELTQAQADERLDHISEHIDELGEARFPGRGFRGHRGP